jgi:hypothetical protein
MTRTVRLRVARLTLALRARSSIRHPALGAAFRPFLVSRGGDIRLEITDAPPPQPDQAAPLFDSGSVWRVYRRRGGLLYTFRAAGLDPSVYKAVAIDNALSRGRLYFPPQRRRRAPGHPLAFPLDELLFQHRLAREGGLEVHACGLVLRGRLLLFCGESGAGKSTTARLWRRRPDVRILSDDRIALRPRGRDCVGYGTPWHGDGGFASPRGSALGAIFFLRQAPRSSATRLSVPACATRLFARSFPPPWDARATSRVLGACARIAERVPGFELRFRPDASAVETVLRLLQPSPLSR